METIPVVDIFAGPGGLGEGFSAFETTNGVRPFKIAVSAEKDEIAHRTLRLRAFVRAFGSPRDIPASYYEYLKDPSKGQPYDARTKAEWEKAEAEALNLTLGIPKDNAVLYAEIARRTSPKKPWVLIGGPPCQAYSLVGRARNKGTETYRPEKDDRHYLYKEYLEILSTYQPYVFIMENVRGILTSAVEGKLIFDQILKDLQKPSAALGRKGGAEYEILALASSGKQEDSSKYIVRSEDYGVPQSRHRVILLGVRTDLDHKPLPSLSSKSDVTISQAWIGLPKLRSGVSRRGSKRQADDPQEWAREVRNQRKTALDALGRSKAKADIRDVLSSAVFRDDLTRGAQYIKKAQSKGSTAFRRWVRDPRLEGIVNHQSRSHMPADLGRYMFCAAYAAANEGRSPRASDFPAALIPKHKSWKKDVFVDRFKVQPRGSQSGTITSHIAKDGHYFIHFDIGQCRSMTVREAARLQTFPDNYFFCGNRTQQYVQVGNAVPPLLARSIAEAVWELLGR